MTAATILETVLKFAPRRPAAMTSAIATLTQCDAGAFVTVAELKEAREKLTRGMDDAFGAARDAAVQAGIAAGRGRSDILADLSGVWYLSGLVSLAAANKRIGAALTPIEFNGQRVITLAMMDRAHQRPEGTARRNFNTNKLKLVEGDDYFVRNSSEARGMGVTAPNGLIVLTESGYLLLVKSFTDDLAWQVQRELVNGYFRANRPAAPLPTDYAQALRALACEVEEKERIAAAKALADAELVTARPKAVACDVLSESKGDRCIRTAAKDLKVPERQLIATMIEKGWLFRTHRPDGGTGDLQPTAKIAKLGFAKMIPVHTDAEKTKTRDTLRITNAGLTRLAAMLVKWGLKVGAQTAMVPA